MEADQNDCKHVELHDSLQVAMTSGTCWNSTNEQKSLETEENGIDHSDKVTVCQPSLIFKNNVHSNGSRSTCESSVVGRENKCFRRNVVDAAGLCNDHLCSSVSSNIAVQLNAKSPQNQLIQDTSSIGNGDCLEVVEPSGLNGDNCEVKNTGLLNITFSNCNGESQCTMPNVVIQSVTKCSDTHKSPQQDVSLRGRTRQNLPKTHKIESKVENFRPLGRLLHDLGLELVREQVYCDLIEIQAAKNASNKLEAREKSQLLKLIEAHERLYTRNAPYRLPVKHCSKCKFASFSVNAMVLHQQYGSFSTTDQAAHLCCACVDGSNFSTRSATGYIAHLSEEHNIIGRLIKKPANFSCTNCPYEHRNSARIQIHMAKCLKKYPLICNLQPLPGDCDIALVYRAGDRGLPAILPTNSSWPSRPSAAGAGHASVRNLLDSIRSQQKATIPTDLFLPTSGNIPVSTSSSLICEICGKVVDGREALWNHFRLVHHVELSKTTMREQDPWMKCDVCSVRFWTYQGLSRHLLLAHNRAIAANYTRSNSSPSVSSSAPTIPVSARCHLCGGSQTANPLSHFSAYHNVTLLEMYHAKLCCLCNTKLNSGQAFEEHMVEQHSDIFANHDVLRTVLQALTTARCFKSDDSRQSGLAGHSVHFGQASNKLQVRSVQSVNKPNKHAAAISSNPTRTVKRKESNSVHPSTPIKTPEKSATAEQVKKLYEDLADIGRPILRSMRHKLNNFSLSPNVKADESSASALQLVSDEIPLKKACLDEDSGNPDVVLASVN